VELRGCADSLTGPELETNGLGCYDSSEQQSVCSNVESASAKRIEEAQRLQYAP